MVVTTLTWNLVVKNTKEAFKEIVNNALRYSEADLTRNLHSTSDMKKQEYFRCPRSNTNSENKNRPSDARFSSLLFLRARTKDTVCSLLCYWLTK